MKRKLLSLLSLAAVSLAFGQYTTQNTNMPLQSAGVRDISITNASTAWITFYDGSEGGQTYPRYVGLTTNGGTTWTTKLASALPASALISDIHGKDATAAFMVTAPTGSAGSANGLWKTTDSGTTWTKTSGVFSNNSFGNIVYFWDNNTGIVIGDPINNKYEMYKTTDGGNTWSSLATAPTADSSEEYGYVGGKVGFENHLWLTSNTGRVLHTGDRGVTWSSFQAPIEDFAGAGSSGSLAFTSATHGVIVDSNDLIWITENAGVNWNIEQANDYFTSDLKYIPNTNTLISSGIRVESSQYVGTSYSHDGGKTWTIIEKGIAQRGTIGAFDCNSVWVGGYTADATGKEGIFKLDAPIPGCSLGITEQVNNKVSLKAVVNGGTLNVFANKDIKGVLIVDMTGRSITNVNTKDVNISSLKAGVYIARVAYVDGSFGTVKFVVK